jgi:hypothetical protein
MRETRHYTSRGYEGGITRRVRTAAGRLDIQGRVLRQGVASLPLTMGPAYRSLHATRTLGTEMDTAVNKTATKIGVGEPGPIR